MLPDKTKNCFFISRSMKDYAVTVAKWITELPEYPGPKEFGDFVTLHFGRWQMIHNKRAALRFQRAISKECERILKG